tara:strand:- start:6256 stop:6426 length:171 start_codon:yes stop_codon:yes gene_type:complete
MNYKITNKSFHKIENTTIAMILIAFVAMLVAVYVPEFTSNLKTGVGGNGLDYNLIP